ncbi:MAG: hypothetical protein HRF45_06065 [Fimbriimonadia bacterium]
MKAFVTLAPAVLAAAWLVGCQEQSGQLTPIDIEKMRPKVEIPESGKAPPKSDASQAPLTDIGATERLPERPPAGFEAPALDDGTTPRPTIQPPPGAVGPDRPYLEGGDLSPLGSGSGSGGPTAPGETAPGSISTGL